MPWSSIFISLLWFPSHPQGLSASEVAFPLWSWGEGGSSWESSMTASGILTPAQPSPRLPPRPHHGHVCGPQEALSRALGVMEEFYRSCGIGRRRSMIACNFIGPELKMLLKDRALTNLSQIIANSDLITQYWHSVERFYDWRKASSIWTIRTTRPLTQCQTPGPERPSREETQAKLI